jgi:hypothetical protein
VAFALLNFGIMSSLRPHARDLRLTISKAADLKRFAEQIGFLQPEKQQSLVKYVDDRRDITSRGREKGRKRRSVFWDEIAKIEPFESDDPYSYEVVVALQFKNAARD